MCSVFEASEALRSVLRYLAANVGAQARPLEAELLLELGTFDTIDVRFSW